METVKDLDDDSIAAHVKGLKRGTNLWLKVPYEDANAANKAAPANKKIATNKPKKSKITGPVHLGEPDENISDGEEGDAPLFKAYSLFDWNTWPLKDMLGAGKDFTYAPCRVNAYYLEVTGGDIGDLGGSMPKWDEEEETAARKRSPGNPGTSEIYYLSLKFLLDLAKNQIPWDKLEKGMPDRKDPSPEELKKEARELDAMEFPDLDNFPAVPSSEIKNAKVVRIPLRAQSGHLKWVALHGFNLSKTGPALLDELFKIKEKFFKLLQNKRAAEGLSGGSYRGRYEDIDLGFPLVIGFADAQGPLRCENYAKVKKLVTDLVEQINQPRLAMPGNPTMLECMPEEEAILSNLVKVADNPFGLYSTYISPDNLHSYMLSFANGTKKVRKQPKPGETQQVVQLVVPNTTPINPVRHLPKATQLVDLKAHKDSTIAKRKKLSDKQEAGEAEVKKQKTQAAGDFQTFLHVPVSALKIENAKSKRNQGNGAAKIMNMSASECATDKLKWEHRLEKKSDGTDQKPRVLGNGLHVAEWLHLAAFSWGGLLALPTNDQDEQHESSDVPSNLVMGTSETNSQMTRFEKAWQDLVRDETLLTANDAFSGTLMIVRNPLGDKKKGQDKTCQVLTDHRGATEYGHEWVSLGQKPSTGADLLGMAADMSFLAYSVSYSLSFSSKCNILALQPSIRLTTTFYPFLRPFYHALEAKLDAALYKHMKTCAGAELAQLVQNNDPGQNQPVVNKPLPKKDLNKIVFNTMNLQNTTKKSGVDRKKNDNVGFNGGGGNFQNQQPVFNPQASNTQPLFNPQAGNTKPLFNPQAGNTQSGNLPQHKPYKSGMPKNRDPLIQHHNPNTGQVIQKKVKDETNSMAPGGNR